MRAALFGLCQQTLQHKLDVAQMRPGDLVSAGAGMGFGAGIGKADQRGGEGGLAFSDAQHKLLVGAQRVAEHAHPLRQLGQGLAHLRPALLPAGKRALQLLHVFRGLLQQRLHIYRHRAIALGQDAGGKPRQARQPFFQLVVKAVLRLSGGKVEKAQYQRAGKAEHRGRKRRAHAGNRLDQA